MLLHRPSGTCAEPAVIRQLSLPEVLGSKAPQMNLSYEPASVAGWVCNGGASPVGLNLPSHEDSRHTDAHSLQTHPSTAEAGGLRGKLDRALVSIRCLHRDPDQPGTTCIR